MNTLFSFYDFLCFCDRGDEDDDEWEDTDEEDEFDSEGEFSGEEDVDDGGREFLFMDEETKSRFTEYSLTSSVMRRNEQLSLLDERFEKVSACSVSAALPSSSSFSKVSVVSVLRTVRR